MQGRWRTERGSSRWPGRLSCLGDRLLETIPAETPGASLVELQAAAAAASAALPFLSCRRRLSQHPLQPMKLVPQTNIALVAAAAAAAANPAAF